MPIRFKILAGQNLLGYVPAVPAVHGGVWCGNLGLLRPDLHAVSALMPYRWRKGWQRSSGSFWFDARARFSPNAGLTQFAEGSCDIDDVRGELMVALRAVPIFSDEE